MDKVADQIVHTLRSYGIRAGETICVCLPDIKERKITALACAKLNVKNKPLAIERLNEASLIECLKASKAKILIIADWCLINNKLLPCKTIADRSSVFASALDYIITVRNLGHAVSWLDGRDVWWDTLMDDVFEKPM